MAKAITTKKKKSAPKKPASKTTRIRKKKADIDVDNVLKKEKRELNKKIEESSEPKFLSYYFDLNSLNKSEIPSSGTMLIVKNDKNQEIGIVVNNTNNQIEFLTTMNGSEDNRKGYTFNQLTELIKKM